MELTTVNKVDQLKFATWLTSVPMTISNDVDAMADWLCNINSSKRVDPQK